MKLRGKRKLKGHGKAVRHDCTDSGCQTVNDSLHAILQWTISGEMRARLVLTRGILSEPAGGDIEVHANHSLGFAGGIVENLALGGDPTDATAGGAGAMFHRPIMQLFAQEFLQLPDDPIAVFGKEAHLPFFA